MAAPSCSIEGLSVKYGADLLRNVAARLGPDHLRESGGEALQVLSNAPGACGASDAALRACMAGT